MSNPWKKVTAPVVAENLSDIMSEQYAKGLQVQEEIKFAELMSNQQVCASSSDDVPPEILQQIQDSNLTEYCDSDAIIAKTLQCQFDKQHDDEIKRVEKKRNGDAKVSVSYDNYRNIPENFVYDTDSEDEDVDVAAKKDWDRFETNQKEYASLPKRGYFIKDGEMVTKHDSVINDSNLTEYCDSDAIIAKMLQCQFDKDYDDEIKRVEKKRNGDAKVSVSYDNYRNIPENLVYDTDSEEEDVDVAAKKDWDRFEKNQKEYASLPKRGYVIKDGEMVTKHDSVINGRRNACRIMQFPPEVCTGDGASFDMKLPNSVFNHLKEQAIRHHQSLKHKKMLDRKESQATAEMGLDEATRLILFKLINNGMLEDINGIISTGKESVVLHANSDPSFPDMILPKECAIKVFKTTLNEFKTRDKYIKADYRFKDRFSKQNPRKIVHMWAEKEMHNMMRMQKIGLNCPDMICLKKHILVMSFIGRDNKPAPKLRDAVLSLEKWGSVYREVLDGVHKLYKEGHMIHADLSEYNILWWENKCWFIDVSQSVQPDHPMGLEFLLRDCRNISNFFNKKGVPDVKTAEELFKSITGFEEVDVNLLEGVHTTYNSLSSRFEIAPDDNRNVSYPFEYCWKKSSEPKLAKSVADNESDEDDFEEMWSQSQKAKAVDTATNFGNEVNLQQASTSIVDKQANFGNVIDIIKIEDIGRTEKEKKS